MDVDFKHLIQEYLFSFGNHDDDDEVIEIAKEVGTYMPSQDDFKEGLDAIKCEDRLDYVLMTLDIEYLNDMFEESLGEKKGFSYDVTPIDVAAQKGHLRLLDIMLDSLSSTQLLKVLCDRSRLYNTSCSKEYHSLETMIKHLVKKCEAGDVVETLLQSDILYGAMAGATGSIRDEETERDADQYVVDVIALIIKCLREIDTSHISTLLALRDSENDTVLHLAMENELARSVLLLKEQILKLEDIKPMLGQNKKGKTVIHLATAEEYTDVLEAFLSHSSISDDNVVSLLLNQDLHGNTILHFAVFNANIKALRLLLDPLTHADKLKFLSLRAIDRSTPIEVAKKQINSQTDTAPALTEVYDALQQYLTEAKKSHNAEIFQ